MKDEYQLKIMGEYTTVGVANKQGPQYLSMIDISTVNHPTLKQTDSIHGEAGQVRVMSFWGDY